METQKTSNSKAVLRKKDGAGRSHQDSMVLAEKQKYRPMEQDKTHARMGTLFLTKEARIYTGTKTAMSIGGSRKTGQLHVKE